MPKCIDVILNWFNMETPRRVLVAWNRLKQDSVFHNAWWAKRMSDFSIMYAMLCTQTRYVLCSKKLRAYTRMIIWWSLDNSKNILKYFRRTNDVFCMWLWQTIHCKVLHHTCYVTNTNILSQLGYVFNKRWRSGLEESSMLDLDEFQS